MNKRTTIFLILSAVFLIFTTVNAVDKPRAPRININTINSDDFIGQAGILHPLKSTEDTLLYTDLRNRFSNDGVHEWNIGIGYREKFESENKYIAGLYLYKDKREEFNHYWNMWTFGGEILTDNLDMRMNTYITDNKTIPVLNGNSALVKNRRIIFQKSYYTSMDGFDFEIGKRWKKTEGILKNVGAYLKIYNFFADSAQSMVGEQISVNKLFGDRDKTNYYLGVQWRDDNLRGSELETAFSISIPFGKGSINSSEETNDDILESRMTEQPKRDLDIVVGERKTEGEARDIYGKTIGKVSYVTAGGTGDGSKENPAGITNYDSDTDVIIVLGDGGEISINNSIQLAQGQKLLSPGGYLLVSIDKEGRNTALFRPVGKQAILKTNSSFKDESLIELANDTTVSGFKLISVGEAHEAIHGDNVAGLSITNNSIDFTNNQNANRVYGIKINNMEINNPPVIKNNIIDSTDLGLYFVSTVGDIKNIEQQYNNENTFKNIDADLKSINNPYGENAILIFNWKDLKNIWNDIAGTYILVKDLDKNSAEYDQYASNTANSGQGWRPIGDLSNHFTGIFDGQGNTITDLKINRSGQDLVGLFGYTGNTSEIKNIGLQAVTINGRMKVGGLVGRNEGSIYNSQITGDIKSVCYVGGLVGYNTGAVDNSYSSATVEGVNQYGIGGLIGINDSKGTVYHSYALGDVSASGINAQFVGGLIGANNGSVIDSYAKGNVTGNDSIGGLVGDNSGTIVTSYSTGDVEGNSYIGGLVGYNKNVVENSYSSGEVTGTVEYAGGLVGANVGTINNSFDSGKVIGPKAGGLVGVNAGTIKNSYWNKTYISTGIFDNYIATVNVLGLTTSEMKDINSFLPEWDITTVEDGNIDTNYIWNIVDGITYPFLSGKE